MTASWSPRSNSSRRSTGINQRFAVIDLPRAQAILDHGTLGSRDRLAVLAGLIVGQLEGASVMGSLLHAPRKTKKWPKA